MSHVQGSNVLFKIYDGSSWKNYACCRNVTWDETTDDIETSVSGQGWDATFTPTKNSFSASLTGITVLNEVTKIMLPDLRTLQRTHTIFRGRLERTADDGTVYNTEASFFITRCSDGGAVNEGAVFSVDMKGTGTPVDSSTPPATVDPTDERFEYTAVGDEIGFSDTSMISKYIVEVNRDGIGYSPIITSGSPVGKEVKYISASGAFEFEAPMEVDEEVYVIFHDI